MDMVGLKSVILLFGFFLFFVSFFRFSAFFWVD